jgi:starch phosphorylase
MNGALTIGTRDGATIEMAAAGRGELLLFGLSAEEVANSRGTYNPQERYDNDPDARRARSIAADHFSRNEPGSRKSSTSCFARAITTLHLPEPGSYSEAHARLGELYRDQENWSRKAVLNIAASRTFSSDRTIAEYARDIWHAEPCAVD